MKMKLGMALKTPFRNLRNTCKINPAVVISGLLTIMYCVEYSIGIRTIYITLKLWNDPDEQRVRKRVSWTLCLACLLTATITSFTINLLSAIWEQKQLEVKGKPKNFLRFLGHFIVGGMLWRYFHLLFVASLQFRKKLSLLLTMVKFFFTQAFTIPMTIIHVSVTEDIDEMIFAFVNIFCISLNLILTCTQFSVCVKELEELKKWDYETVDLIPLLFQWEPPAHTNTNFKVASNFSDKEDPRAVKKESKCERAFEEIVIKTLVLIQSFGFSLGRLMALGILVKLAGIYAVSIMFLQLLISVIYLKFQAPILVSDTLPKWRQLTRLAFLGYILIFEWHLNREPRTAYDFSFNMKHNILYYCVATVESVFYLVTWTITTSILSKSELPEIRDQQNAFCRLILLIGSLSLVFSLSIHILLLFWRSRRISKLFYSFRRKYEKTKIRLSRYGGRNNVVSAQEKAFRRPISHIDISNPLPVQRGDMSPGRAQMYGHPQNQTSYRDLREPLDEDSEIFRKCEGQSSNPKLRELRRGGMPQSDYQRRETIQAIDHVLREEVNNYQNSRYSPDRRQRSTANPPTIITSSYSPGSRSPNKNTSLSASMQEHTFKSRISSFSDNINDRFEKMSRKISGAVNHFGKKKDQFGNYLGNSKTSDAPVNPSSPYRSPSKHTVVNVHRKVPSESVSLHKGYYVGETRCYRIDYSPSQVSIHKQKSPTMRARYGEEVRSPSFGRSPSPMRSPMQSSSPVRSNMGSSLQVRSNMGSSLQVRSQSPMGSSSEMRSPMGSSSYVRSSSPERSSSPYRSSSPKAPASPRYTHSPNMSPSNRPSPSHRLSPSPGLSPTPGYYDSPINSPEHERNFESPPPRVTPSPMFSSPRIAPPPDLTNSPRKSPGRDKMYDASQTHEAHRKSGTPCPCYICKNTENDRFSRRRSSSVPPGERSPNRIEEDSEISYTSSKYMSNPNISQNRSRFDARSRDAENLSAAPRVSRRNFNIGHLTAHGRVEHYV